MTENIPPKTVTVFGSSTIVEGSQEWTMAYNLGYELAKRGFGVKTGGYGGSMEAVSRGAAEAQCGVEIEGVICSRLFPLRPKRGNAYLTRITDPPSLVSRLQHLVEEGDTRFFVVLPGSLGTAMELMLVWNLLYIEQLSPNSQHGENSSRRHQLFAFRETWDTFVRHMQQDLSLSDAVASQVQLIDSVEECVQRIEASYTKATKK